MRQYLNRNNAERLSEEIQKRQLAATSTKDKKTRQNYLTRITKLKDELRQIDFYRKKLERLDSYLIKVAATMSNTHSKVLQIGVSGDFRE